MIDYILKFQNDNKDLIAGFDMVQEEDISAPIQDFSKLILDAREKSGSEFPVILHAGETTKRFSENLIDAIILGTKRIGHGFQIA